MLPYSTPLPLPLSLHTCNKVILVLLKTGCYLMIYLALVLLFKEQVRKVLRMQAWRQGSCFVFPLVSRKTAYMWRRHVITNLLEENHGRSPALSLLLVELTHGFSNCSQNILPSYKNPTLKSPLAVQHSCFSSFGGRLGGPGLWSPGGCDPVMQGCTRQGWALAPGPCVHQACMVGL